MELVNTAKFCNKLNITTKHMLKVFKRSSMSPINSNPCKTREILSRS